MELESISRIDNGLYLSGVYGMENVDTVGNLKIKYILSCISRKEASDVHNDILAKYPDITVLYLPYRDNILQDLWQVSNSIEMIKYSGDVVGISNNLQTVQKYHKMPMIEVAYDFINKAIEEKKNILVHCQMGISRSSSAIIYYYMKKTNIGYTDAEQYVKSKRSIVNPNPSFKTQLSNYHTKKLIN